MKSMILSLAARRRFQPFWRFLFRVVIGGLGYVNGDTMRNGERHCLSQWATARRRAGGGTAVVFDVGANEGHFTAAVLSLVDDVRVHCFEPNPETHARLAARFAGDARVIVNHCGVGAHAGRLALHDYADGQGSSHASFLAETFRDIHPGATRSVSVPVVTVDDYLRDHGIERIDYLKLDVEGFEKEVFAGMAETIARGGVDVIQFEFNMHNAVTGLSLYRIGQALPGYDICKLLPDGEELVLGKGCAYNGRIEIFKYSNFIARRRA